MGRSTPQANLSRRERQIVAVISGLGRGTGSAVLGRLPGPPSCSAVRALIRILEDKGHLRHEQEGTRCVDSPVTPGDSARISALRHLVNTLSEGSTTAAVAALLDDSEPLPGPSWNASPA